MQRTGDELEIQQNAVRSLGGAVCELKSCIRLQFVLRSAASG
jgi:hypothetical protein